MTWPTCRWCKRRQWPVFTTDGNGRVIEAPLPCGCKKFVELDLCVRCQRRPRLPRAIRCETCHRARRTAIQRRYRERNPDVMPRVNRDYRERLRAASLCIQGCGRETDGPVRCHPCARRHREEARERMRAKRAAA